MYFEDYGKVSEELKTEALDALQRYKGEKEFLHSRIRENVAYYMGAYQRLYTEMDNKTHPWTAYVLSAVENKYADYCDNFPTANFLAREEGDDETARLLSEIMPVQLELSDFKKAYKKNIRQKLITGTGIYGVFWNEQKKDVSVKSLDIMSVYCDMNVDDVQKSRFVFVSFAIENDKLKKLYPKYADMFDGDITMDGTAEQKRMVNCTEITDCYYKDTDGRVHMMKLANGTIIDATENMPGYEKGLYGHGKFPIIFDVMYPEPKGPFGFGMIDVIKNPQFYIDRLDGAILKNAMLSSGPKWLYKDTAGVNVEELADMEKEFVKASNVSDDAIRPVTVASMNEYVIEYRTRKIEEMKEVAANRDFQSGGTSGGVTAASAITVLQEAGNKISRAMIDDSFDAYKELVLMMIELMREFFDKDRMYRITGTDGRTEFARLSKDKLVPARAVTDSLGFVVDTEYKNAIFDVEIVPQRQNLYQRETQNQLYMQLWQAGFFLPQNLAVSRVALKNMNFDGKDILIQDLEELEANQMQQQMQQMGQGVGGEYV